MLSEIAKGWRMDLVGDQSGQQIGTLTGEIFLAPRNSTHTKKLFFERFDYQDAAYYGDGSSIWTQSHDEPESSSNSVSVFVGETRITSTQVLGIFHGNENMWHEYAKTDPSTRSFLWDPVT